MAVFIGNRGRPILKREMMSHNYLTQREIKQAPFSWVGQQRAQATGTHSRSTKGNVYTHKGTEGLEDLEDQKLT